MPSKKINIDRLIDSYLDAASNNPGSLDDMLKEHGYDPQKIEKSGVNNIKKLMFQQQVAINRDKLLSLYSKALLMVQVATTDTKQAIFTLLKQKSPSLQFRNLENLDEENLRQILTETEILDFIEKLENGEAK
jgi:3-methyladenine DNA glycosylase Tag